VPHIKAAPKEASKVEYEYYYQEIQPKHAQYKLTDQGVPGQKEIVPPVQPERDLPVAPEAKIPLGAAPQPSWNSVPERPSMSLEIPVVSPLPLEKPLPDGSKEIPYAPLVQVEAPIEKPPLVETAPMIINDALMHPATQSGWAAPATGPPLVAPGQPVQVVVPDAPEIPPVTPSWNKQKATAVTQVRWISQYVTLEPATTRYWRPRTSIRWIRATTWFRPDEDYYYEEAAGSLNKADISTVATEGYLGNFPIHSDLKNFG